MAEHDLVSEVYHVTSGSTTLVLGPDIANRQRRPATARTVGDEAASRTYLSKPASGQ